MQRTLVLSGIFPNRRNPTWGIHVFHNVLALAPHHSVRVMAPVPLVPRLLGRGRYRHYVGVPRADRLSDLPVEYPRFFVVPKLGRFLHGAGLFLSILPAMARQVRSFRPDVLLAYFAFPYGFAAVWFGALFRVPVVVSCRGSDINLMTRPRLQGSLIGWSLRACDRVFVMSEDMRERVLAAGVPAGRIDVVGNGVDTRVFFPRDRAAARDAQGIPRAQRVLVCVSRLSAEKGIDVLVDAVAMMRSPDLRVFVVGDGVMRAALVSRAGAAGLGGVIEFAGTRPHAEVPAWLACADVVVLPSRSEGMPNVVLEAMACGRYVVATAVGGTRELITDPSVGRLVPPGDAAALAAALGDSLAATHDPDRIVRAVSARTWNAVGARAAAQLETAVRTARAARARRAQKATWHPGTH